MNYFRPKPYVSSLKEPVSQNSAVYLFACLAMLILAFVQCFRVTRGLEWAYDGDFDRDMAFVQGIVDGHAGVDPNYLGEFPWYNPLLFYVEAGIVKLTALPVNLVVSQAGIYIDLLGPLTFLTMVARLFDVRTAAAAFLSYMFLASGNIVATASATYSPWPYPVTFVQFTFYLSIYFCYLAYSTQRYYWFAILGISCGICFLGHTGPAVVMVLVLILLQGDRFIQAAKGRDFALVKKLLLQGLLTFVFFLLAALPLLYAVVWKYHLHFENRAIFEYRGGILRWGNYRGFLKANINLQFTIAVAGFIWFYRNFHQGLVRKIVLYWLYSALFMFLYTSLLPLLHEKLHIQLPDTCPSYHYFFYLKAIQSVFFGIGCIFLLKAIYRKLAAYRAKTQLKLKIRENQMILLVLLLYAFLYFPTYMHRQDFVERYEEGLIRRSEKAKIEVYHYIVAHIPDDKVILCEEEANDFPVMASGRKMVSTSLMFSNPYVNYQKRSGDRNDMLSYLGSGQPSSAKSLFGEYKVGFILLKNQDSHFFSDGSPADYPLLFRNDQFSLYLFPR